MQAYFSTAPAKVSDLRPDTLAIMMSLANVSPHARVLCMDTCFGTVTTACVERMAGHGTLCCGHLDNKRGRLDAPRLLNKRHWLAQSARHMTVAALLQAEASREVDVQKTDDATTNASAAPDNGAASAAEEAAARSAVEDASPSAQPGDAERTASEAVTTRPRLHEPVPAGARVPDGISCATDEETALMARHGFDSVVLAAPRYEPGAIMLRLRPLMQPSASIVVFSQSMQPLVECYHALQQSREFIGLQVRIEWESPSTSSCSHNVMSGKVTSVARLAPTPTSTHQVILASSYSNSCHAFTTSEAASTSPARALQADPMMRTSQC